MVSKRVLRIRGAPTNRPVRSESESKLKSLSPGEGIRKTWYVHTMECYSSFKKGTGYPVIDNKGSLEDTIRGEISQSQKDTYYLIPLI